MEAHRSDGKSGFPYGQDATGILIYLPDGYMSAQIMRPNRPLFASREARVGKPEEIEKAYLGYLAYWGRYEVNEAASSVTHYPEGSLFPNWVGMAQLRHLELNGNRLVIKTPPQVFGGRTTITTLTWEKM